MFSHATGVSSRSRCARLGRSALDCTFAEAAVFAIFFFEKMACLPIFYHQGTMKTGVRG